MKLHEFQDKEVFRNAGIPVPEGKVVTSGDEAVEAADADDAAAAASGQAAGAAGSDAAGSGGGETDISALLRGFEEDIESSESDDEAVPEEDPFASVSLGDDDFVPPPDAAFDLAGEGDAAGAPLAAQRF